METNTAKAKFQAHLQRGGAGIAEMRRLLEIFAEHGDYTKLKQQVRQENLLGKTSDQMTKELLSAFKRRFLQTPDLPPGLLVARAVRAPLPEAAKNQILFPYFVVTDPLAEECYRSLVLSRTGNPKATLTREEVTGHLHELGRRHPELAGWSEYLRLRWSRGFLALLRQFGLLERHPRQQLRRLYLLPEAFAFFWLWLYRQEGSFWGAAGNETWTFLQVNGRDKDELLAEGQLRGWWHYQRAGEIVSFAPRFPGLEEWLKNGLA